MNSRRRASGGRFLQNREVHPGVGRPFLGDNDLDRQPLEVRCKAKICGCRSRYFPASDATRVVAHVTVEDRLLLGQLRVEVGAHVGVCRIAEHRVAAAQSGACRRTRIFPFHFGSVRSSQLFWNVFVLDQPGIDQDASSVGRKPVRCTHRP